MSACVSYSSTLIVFNECVTRTLPPFFVKVKEKRQCRVGKQGVHDLESPNTYLR